MGCQESKHADVIEIMSCKKDRIGEGNSNVKKPTLSHSLTEQLMFPQLDRSRFRASWSDVDISNFGFGGQHTSIVGQFYNSKYRHTRVLIKIIAVCKGNNQNERNNCVDGVEIAWREAQLISDISKRLKDCDNCVIHLVGVCEGFISNEQTKCDQENIKAVGIILKSYKNGTLDNYIHNKTVDLTLIFKLQILHKIARALMDLHSIGVIYGNLKLSDVILTDHSPPEIRLKDFGNSLFRTDLNDVNVSMLQYTSSVGTTNPYQAPELMSNPFESNDYQQTKIAKCSRKTDMYAFSIVAWEVLSCTKPYKGVMTGILPAKVHKGHRPPLDNLPYNTPPIVNSMIQRCWDASRENRLSAVECTSILQHCVDLFAGEYYDIFFSHAWVMKPILCHVYQLLAKMGYRVWYDQEEMGHDLQESMKKGIANSKVVVVCINKTYQDRPNCMYELEEAHKNASTIVPIILDSKPTIWANDRVQDICNFSECPYCDLSELARLDWSADDGPTDEMLNKLKLKVELLRVLLEQHNCHPQLIMKNQPIDSFPSVKMERISSYGSRKENEDSLTSPCKQMGSLKVQSIIPAGSHGKTDTASLKPIVTSSSLPILDKYSLSSETSRQDNPYLISNTKTRSPFSLLSRYNSESSSINQTKCVPKGLSHKVMTAF